MNCEKILNLFRSELITVNVGPKLLATSLEMQGYKAWICWEVWTDEGAGMQCGKHFPEIQAL